MAIWHIGIDDTDNAESRGTGHLARMVLRECAARGLRPRGVTRHQFLLDPRIPYTSHNSGACVSVEGPAGVGELDFAFDLVAASSADGSDPGLCVAEEGSARGVAAFGKAAAERVLEMPEAFRQARRAGVRLRGLGGSCQGVIGALASVGQRAEGNEGRFIDLPGLRDLPRRVRSETLAAMGIEVEHVWPERQPARDDVYDTLEWIRPNLRRGRPLWMVRWSEEHHAWIPVQRKRSPPPG